MNAKLRHLLRGALRRVKRGVDRVYRKRHPAKFERAAMRFFAPVVRLMPANDRWSLGVHAPYWMSAVAAAPGELRSLRPRRVFQLACYRGQFSLELSLAALLAAQGHAVTLGYLPKLASPVKMPLDDHPSAPAYLADSLATVEATSQGRVKIVDLEAFDAAESASDDLAPFEAQASADAIMQLGVETIDCTDPAHRASLDTYARLGRKTARIARNFLEQHGGDFDVLLIANGMTTEAAWFVQAGLAAGAEVVTYEKFAFRHTRVVSHGAGVFSFTDLGRVWEMREKLGYEAEPFRSTAIERSFAILDERRKASTKNWAWKYQFAPDQSDAAALAAANIDASKPYVLVCTNVPFDAGYYQFTKVFPSMKTWLVETVRFLLAETDLNVVVRVHPGEALHFAGRERSVDNLRAAGLHNDARLTVIGPDAAINTYPLMAHCRAGVVFSSTTGIEMAMQGKPVIVGADVYFAGRGFTVDCSGRDAYFENLRACNDGARFGGESRAVAERAALFYYVIHFVLQLAYPYDKGYDIDASPPHETVRRPDFANYAPFFAVATATRAEFDAVILEHLHAEALARRHRAGGSYGDA